VTRSLRRTLAVRFAATMAVGLTLACVALYWVTGRVMEREGRAALAPAAGLQWARGEERDLLVALVAVIIAGTSATLVGAWWLAGSAVRPVREITLQATHIEAGTLDRPIAAHADTEEYQGLVAVLNRMLDRLNRTFRAQQRLTADVSHELRTPLTALRGLMEVALRSERTPREYQHTLRSALEEIDRLAELSEDLLLVTRADARLMTPRRVPTDLNVVVREELEAVNRKLLEKDLASGAVLDPAVPSLPLDAPLVGRVIGHLLDNAGGWPHRRGDRPCLGRGAFHDSGLRAGVPGGGRLPRLRGFLSRRPGANDRHGRGSGADAGARHRAAPRRHCTGGERQRHGSTNRVRAPGHHRRPWLNVTAG